ncbi:FAD-dependent monooxygenase [Streptomyces sp. NPDC057403]|uniref:FAD-dependent monooxygenase n=1 Tax=Streptomyces sp. NPDC057403 TaxID=3346119 RepID=UPI003689BC83
MGRVLEAEVVVVGGGPVGLVVACELARYGVRTVVLEAETAVSRRPKATTLHARSVQCLVRRGYLGGLAHPVGPADTGSTSAGSSNARSFSAGSFSAGSFSVGSASAGSAGTRLASAGFAGSGPTDTGSTSTGSTSTGSTSTGPTSTGSTSADSSSTHSSSTRSSSTGSTSAGSADTGSSSVGSSCTGSTSTGPAGTGPADTGSTSTGFSSAGSTSAGSTSTGPAGTDSSSAGSASAGSAGTGPLDTDSSSARSSSAGSTSAGSFSAGSSSTRSSSTGSTSASSTSAGFSSSGSAGTGSSSAGSSSAGSASAGSAGTGPLDTDSSSARSSSAGSSSTGSTSDRSAGTGPIDTGSSSTGCAGAGSTSVGSSGVGLVGGGLSGVGVSCGFHFAGMGGLVISAPVGEPVAVLKCVQEELERVFEGCARGVGVRVVRGVRVVGVRQGVDGVEVVGRGPGGWVRCRAGFVVGADGARSVVRELGGFVSGVVPASVSAMAGDVRLDRVGDLAAGWWRTERGWIVAKPVAGGRVRLRTLNCAGAVRERRRPLGLEELRREVSWIAGRDVGMGAPRWLSRFSDFSRLAGCYRRGRVLLAGDAAHVCFPIGGQGLSAGLLDAIGLGWKLAYTVRGWAGEGLLDTYDLERRPAAQRVIDHTRAQLALMRPDPELEPLRGVFGRLLSGGAQAEALALMVSGQDTVLPGHAGPWGGRFLSNIALVTAQGETDVISLLGRGRPVLLLLDAGSAAGYAEQARSWAGVVDVVSAVAPAGLGCDALLVRPDGYVAWAAGGGALDAVLAAYFGPGGGRAAEGAGAVSRPLPSAARPGAAARRGPHRLCSR